MKKVLVLFTIISVAFTSCEKDETLTTPPVVEIDIRDQAVGLFETSEGGEEVQFNFLKNDDIQDQMILQNAEDEEETVTLFNIVEGEYGLDYDVDEDGFTGIYNKTTDTHTLRILETGFAIRFHRVN